jgi:radical SAM superfamily enzyme YgiQ (UPF0313 family)
VAVPVPRVVLIGFQQHPNLGLGYMAAVLNQHGFETEVIDFCESKAAILEKITQRDPLIVGLSVIFQYYTPEFSELATYLRDHGVAALICAGGHYPSLRPAEILEAMPAVDCIVRFEGELALLELAQRLAAGRDWHDVQSLAYRDDGRAVTTPLRPLIDDLDHLPFPVRFSFLDTPMGIRATSLLASRGCPRACSFCSIRRFYAIPQGRIRRTRSPQNVVAEMGDLFTRHGVRIFLFQDDDFSFMSRRDRQWIWDFRDCLVEHDLATEVIWKISCRADEVNHEIFTALKAAGLYLVYLGLESGNEIGLRTLNKGITVAQNREAVRILKAIGVRYNFGFMLFDPSSTLELVLENVRFLREIGDDGTVPLTLGKMMPYAETDIEDDLRREGRLRGTQYRPDYAYLDPRLDGWFDYLWHVLHGWIAGSDSLLNQLKWSRTELDVMQRFFPETPGLNEHRERITLLIQHYNDVFCHVIEDSSPFFSSGHSVRQEGLYALQQAAQNHQQWLSDHLRRQRDTFYAGTEFPPMAQPAGEI